MEASIGINIRGPSRTAYVSKKDEDDKKKAGQSYTVLCESFGSAVSTLKDGCGRQSEKEEEEEEEDHGLKTNNHSQRFGKKERKPNQKRIDKRPEKQK